MSPTRLASQNAAALQAAISAAQCAGGGVVLIPSVGRYKVQGPITIGTPTVHNPTPLVIAVTAQGKQSAPLLVNQKDDNSPNNTDLFAVYATFNGEDQTDDDIGGITFQNLQIQYVTGSAGIAASGAAIHVVMGQNVRVNPMRLLRLPAGSPVRADAAMQHVRMHGAIQ